MSTSYQAIIVGGGMYGCVIASHLADHFGFKRVLLVEAESALLTRASLNNQARVHNGYHYPRSYTTGYRSRINLPRFVKDWQASVRSDFTKLYAIARQNSKVTAKQFERFCHEIGASFEPAQPAYAKLFNRRLIESVYEVEEFAFDANVLADIALESLKRSGVELRLNTRVESLSFNGSQYQVLVKGASDQRSILSAGIVFNCTYSGLNQLGGTDAGSHFSDQDGANEKGDVKTFPGLKTALKHEVTEMALLEPPSCLKDLGITVMDGPFFSFMPYPARNLHTLSHVRFTPHFNWQDEAGINPYTRLNAYHRESRVERMLRDASRYLPSIQDAKYVDSLFEVKTVLVKNETDDGRPILFEEYADFPGLYSVLGGKIDNIYDILERMETCIPPLKQTQ